MEKISREDAFNYLKSKNFKESQVLKVIKDMGVNPDLQEFEIEKVEQMEKNLSMLIREGGYSTVENESTTPDHLTPSQVLEFVAGWDKEDLKALIIELLKLL